MLTTLLLTLLAAAGPEVEVQTLDGQTLAGPLVGWSAQQVTLEVDGTRRALAADELAWLAPKDPSGPPAKPGKIAIRLVDGSELAAAEYTVHEGQAVILLPGGGKLAAPTRAVAWVRLAAAGPAQREAWQRIAAGAAKADLLVVQQGEALDDHQGLLRDVDDATVGFEMDGETLAVKRPKVFGLVYYHPPAGKLPPAVCRIADVAGAQWVVREASLEGELHWTTPAGVECRQPVQSVARVEFASDKVLYLSDLKPESSRWTPFFQPDAEQGFLTEFFAPRNDRTPDGKPLHLGGKAYRKGVSMHSQTTIVYRLPDGFRRFKAQAGIDDDVRPRGAIRLVIRGDERVLLTAELTGTTPPQSVDLDVTGLRRLTVTAEFGPEQDQGDHLLLCDARVIR